MVSRLNVLVRRHLIETDFVLAIGLSVLNRRLLSSKVCHACYMLEPYGVRTL